MYSSRVGNELRAAEIFAAEAAAMVVAAGAAVPMCDGVGFVLAAGCMAPQ